MEKGLKSGLDAKRIHQDLCSDHGFGGGYDAVKRFVRKLREARPRVFARIEVPPGQEAQVDFGTAAPTLDPKTGKYKKAHFFKMTLSCSRHSYEEVVWKKDLESCIIGARKVHPDGHIEVERAYYSVPHNLVGQSVEVRWDQKMVRVFAHGKLAAVHKRSEDAGRFRTSKSHLPPGRSLSQEAYQIRLMARAEQLGPKVLGFANKAL